MKFDTTRYSQTLAQMISIPTIAHNDDTPTDNVAEFVDYLKSRFPLTFSNGALVDKFNGGIFIKLSGSDSALQPIALMSHLDVVTANASDWTYPPFAAKIVDGVIHGRGAADTKGSLCAIFESVELLLSSGIELSRDLYILSSSREEIAGHDAVAFAKYFADNNIKLKLLVDEGGAILDNPMGGVNGRFAMIAMSERSSCRLNFTCSDTRQLDKLVKKLPKLKITQANFPDEIVEMFSRMSTHMTGVMKLLFNHFNLFKGLLLKVLPKASSSAGAMVIPTITNKPDLSTPTTRVFGLACTYHHDIDKCVANIDNYCAKHNITLKVQNLRKAPPPTDFNAQGVKLVEKAVTAVFADTTPVPFIIFGGTDARHFYNVCDCVVRFAPLVMTNKIVSSVHNANEHLSLQSLNLAVEFYTALILDVCK